MSRSLADLIFNPGKTVEMNSSSQTSNNHNDGDRDTEGERLASSSKSPRKKKTTHLSSIRDTYTYDPVDDFYDDPSTKDSNTKINNTQESTNRNNNVNKKNETKKYDFHLKMEDRDFFTSSQLSTTTSLEQSQMNLATAKAKKRKRTYDNETKEEYMERMRKKKIANARNIRFSRKKYTFDNEIDYGGSVARMVKLQMDVSGRFDHAITKNIKSRHNSGSDQVSIKKRKHGVTGKIEDGESDDSSVYSDDKSEVESVNEDLPKGSNNNNETNHVLGSLLGRIKVQEKASLLEQQRFLQQSGDVIELNDNIELMQQHPMAYLEHGYTAPLSIDPNMQKYHSSVREKSSSREKLGYIRANDSFLKDSSKLRDIPEDSFTLLSHSPQILEESNTKQSHYQFKEIPTWFHKRKKYSNQNTDMILSQFLPMNCFNPNINRLYYPKHVHSYHYFPYSRQDPLSLRINTNNNHFVEQILSPFDPTAQFYNREKKSFDPLYFHSANIHLFVARLIVSCSSLLTKDNTENQNTVNNLSKLFEMLYRKKNTTTRLLRSIRLSQELASNYAMWQTLKDRMKDLHSRKILNTSHYYFLKKELNSDQSDILCDPYTTFESRDIKESASRKRQRILKFIVDLEKESTEEGKESEKRSKYEGLKDVLETKIGPEQDDDMDYPNGVNSTPTMNPFRPIISKSFAKPRNNSSGLQSMTRSEKFSQVLQKTELDFDTIRLTLAMLYSELSVRRSRVPINKMGIESIDEKVIHETILSYLEKIVNDIWFVGSHKSTQAFAKDTINGPLAQATLVKQSYLANSGSNGLIQSKSKKEDVQHDQTTNFRIIAEELSSIGSDLRGPKLSIFTAIHVTTGISFLARSMPSYASEILSRSTFLEPTYDTPIDLVRSALELVEQKGDLMRNQSSSIYQQDEEESVTVDALLSSFENASGIFQDCLELDSQDIDCLSWLVACRFGGMILGSGIAIGGGPTLAGPPPYNDRGEMDSKVRHGEYSKYRALASSSFRSLIDWHHTSGDNGSRYYYFVKSCLEWKEAIFLLAFRPFIHQDCVLKIRLLHAAHTFKWAVREPCISALNNVMSLYESGLIKKMNLLSCLSSLIEAHSNNNYFWVLLSLALGPVGSNKLKECKNKDCLECKKLKNGYLDHKKMHKQRKKNDWWGIDRAKWWNTYYFVLPPSKKIGRKDITCRQKHVEHRSTALVDIKQKIESSCLGQFQESLFSKDNDINFNILDVSWMWSVEPSEDDEEDHLLLDSESDSDSKNSSIGSTKSNRHCKDMPSREIPNVFDSKLLPMSENVAHKLGIDCIIACKVLVACHMYGTCHEFVKDGIGYLWKRILQSRKEERSHEALSFLANQNINVESYLHDFLLEFRKPEPSINSFPFHFTAL